MNEKELSQYYYLKKEIIDIEERLLKLGYGVGSPAFNEIIKSNKKSDSIQEKITELKEQYINARVTAIEQYLKIEQYISNINDSEIRVMFRMRFLDLKNYSEISKFLHLERTTISKKIRTYIKLSHKSH